MTNEQIIEAMAKSDAEFDKRPWTGMGRADRERYLDRARASYAIVEPAIRERSIAEEMEGRRRYLISLHAPATIEAPK